MDSDTAVVETLVIAFPSLAAWIIVALLGVIATGLVIGGKKFLARMDSHDASLRNIESLLASEISKLREMHHDIDKRVTWLEALNRSMAHKRREGDEAA